MPRKKLEDAYLKLKGTETELASKAQKLEDAEKLARFGHWEVRPKSNELYWSDEIYRIHGMEVGSEIDLNEAINVYHPDDRGKVTDFVTAAVEDGRDFAFELRIVRKDGEVRHVKSMGIAHKGDDGTVDAVFGVFQDITELVEARQELLSHQEELEQRVSARTAKLRETDEKFSKFYSVIPDVFMVTSLKSGMCVDVNEGFAETTGYAREEVLGKRTIDLELWADNDDRARLISDIEQHGGVKNFEAKFRRKDGSHWYGSMSAHIIETEEESLFLSVTKDITELYVTRREALDANNAKSDFLSIMSHELRTPLNAIIGFTDVIRNEVFGPLQQKNYAEYIDDVHGSGLLLLSLVDDILDMSKIEAGKLEANLGPVDLGETISDTLTMFQNEASERGVTLAFAPAQASPIVYADGRLTKQVIMNLLSNAVKFTPSDGSVTCQVSASDGAGIVKVTDTGHGMAEDEIAIALQPFMQIGRERNQIQKGTGLGLPISKELIQLQNGSFLIESTPGIGTEVTFSLPLAGE